MITKDKVTEIFCIIDEYDKNFEFELKKNLLPVTNGKKHRNRKASHLIVKSLPFLSFSISKIIVTSSIITSIVFVNT